MTYREISNTISSRGRGFVSGEARGTVNRFYFVIEPSESPYGILARLRFYDSQRQMETDIHSFFLEYREWAFHPNEPLLNTNSGFAMRQTGPNRERQNSQNILDWLREGGRELEKLSKAYKALQELTELGYLDTIRGQLKSEDEVARQYSLDRLAEQRASVAR